MCGIAGIINLSNRVSKIEKKDISILKKMLFSRGPDASGVWHSQKKNIILTTQRLATQDKRPIANQPCWSSDKKIVAILNGEIYNHRELKNKLELKISQLNVSNPIFDIRLYIIYYSILIFSNGTVKYLYV